MDDVARRRVLEATRYDANVRPLLGAQLSTLARRHGIPGAQLAVYHDGDTVAIETGEAEHHSGRRVGRDTAFPIGSITKAFTATVAMILVADGDLDLDEPVGDHLNELDAACGDLTLRQLLSHTGGLAAGPESDDATVSARRYLSEHCRRRNLILTPGTGFSYSNLGYVAVGRLIETITGMSWREATESILLRPLGISPAFVGLPDAGLPGRPLASGHSVNRSAGRTRPVRQALAPAEAPTGALATSALDLVAFGQLHLGEGPVGLLPAEHAAAMRQDTAPTVPFGLADGWGAGLAVFRDGATEWVGHDGNADGTSCYLRIDPVDRWVVALTTNASTGVGLWNDLLADLARAGVPIGQRPAWSPPGPAVPVPRGAAGRYANGDVEYVLAVRDAIGYLSVDGQPYTALTAYADGSFSVRDPLSGRQVLAGRFIRDPAGHRVDGVQLGGRVAPRTAHAARDSRQIRIA